MSCRLDFEQVYPGMKAPSFRCTDAPDGSLILHYYSDRPGLESIVIGIVNVWNVIVSLQFMIKYTTFLFTGRGKKAA